MTLDAIERENFYRPCLLSGLIVLGLAALTSLSFEGLRQDIPLQLLGLCLGVLNVWAFRFFVSELLRGTLSRRLAISLIIKMSVLALFLIICFKTSLPEALWLVIGFFSTLPGLLFSRVEAT